MGGNFAKLDSFVEVATNFTLRAAQSVRQQVFEDSLISAQRRHVSDAPAHGPGPDHSNGEELGHYCPPFSKRTTRASRFVPAAFRLSARRLRSSVSIAATNALMRRNVVVMSST